MKPETTDDTYQAWLARRRQHFHEADLSLLVMASVNSSQARPETSRTRRTPQPSRLAYPRFASLLGVPSTLVGAARLILFVLLVLTPA